MPLTKSSVDETWKTWQEEDAPTVRLLSRAELLAEIEHYHVHPPVEASDLRYWEYWGILPRPVRQKHNGTTAAVYPVWVVTLVMALRNLQADGVALVEMPTLLRAEAQRVSSPPPNSRMLVAGLPPVPRIHERYPLTSELFDSLNPTQRDTVYMVTDMLIKAILHPAEYGPRSSVRITASSEPMLPVNIRRAELILTDDRGRRVTFNLPVKEEGY